VGKKGPISAPSDLPKSDKINQREGLKNQVY